MLSTDYPNDDGDDCEEGNHEGFDKHEGVPIDRCANNVRSVNTSVRRFARGRHIRANSAKRLVLLDWKEEGKTSPVEAHTTWRGSRERSETPRSCRVLQISIGICRMDCSTETAMPADKAGITWGEIEHEGDATLSAASGRGGRDMCGCVAHG